MSFRGLWNPTDPAVADIEKIRRKVARLEPGKMVRLGGMTDCFAPIELDKRVTYETIRALNERKVPYLIVTKSDIVARDEYIDLMDRSLAHIQVTITCFDDEQYKRLNYEKASLPSRRIEAVERLYRAGFDVQVRLSPFIPEFVDFERLNAIQCEKMVVEFLRVNSWIKKWFDLDYSGYTVKHGGYLHLPLDTKRLLISNIRGKRITVCEDEDEAYDFWRNHFNPNPDDCCDLRKES